MKTIVYYISGHGYGHATRSIEVMKALIAAHQDVFLYVRSNAPDWIFRLNLPADKYDFHKLTIDIGAVQNTSMFIEKQATFDAVTKLFNNSEMLIEQEKEFLHSVSADVVVGDIPPLAFEIAARAGTRSVAIANFSWDWIYGPFVTEIPGYSGLIETIRAAYAKADLLLRLPMYGDLSAFRQVTDIPLVARLAKQSRAMVMKKLDLDPEVRKPVVLIALRPSDSHGLDINALNDLSDFVFVSFGLRASAGNIINLPPDYMPFPDLVNACDVAVSKPGYGMVSEVIANRTPLLYIARDDFVEYDILVGGLKRWAVSELLPRERFLNGDWLPAITSILTGEHNWPEIRVDGAGVAAAEILKTG